MRIPIIVPCECGEKVKVEIDSGDTDVNFECPKCGERNIGSLHQGFHIGRRLLSYAANAFEKKDFNFSILLSSMAMDCYLSRLYYKWRDIEELNSGQPYEPNAVGEKILKELQKINDFLEKIRKVEDLIYAKGIGDFIKQHHEINKKIQNGFRSINIDNFARIIRDEVMWKRNDIVHIGRYKYNEGHAKKCYNYSILFIEVLEKMDAEKRL